MACQPDFTCVGHPTLADLQFGASTFALHHPPVRGKIIQQSRQIMSAAAFWKRHTGVEQTKSSVAIPHSARKKAHEVVQ
jgi:hypothetical protein